MVKTKLKTDLALPNWDKKNKKNNYKPIKKIISYTYGF